MWVSGIWGSVGCPLGALGWPWVSGSVNFFSLHAVTYVRGFVTCLFAYPLEMGTFLFGGGEICKVILFWAFIVTWVVWF